MLHSTDADPAVLTYRKLGELADRLSALVLVIGDGIDELRAENRRLGSARRATDFAVRRPVADPDTGRVRVPSCRLRSDAGGDGS